MSRVLSRPMFRRGGSADGITSGLRQGYKHGTSGKDIASGAREYVDLVESLAPSRGIGAGNEFLMNLGLNLVSNPPSGNILQTLGTEAKEPFQQFQKTQRLETAGKRDLIAQYLRGLSDEERSAIEDEIQLRVDELGETREVASRKDLDKRVHGVLKEPGEVRGETIAERAKVWQKTLQSGGAGLNYDTSMRISEAIQDVSDGKNESVTFEEIDIDQPWIDPDSLGTVDSETQVITDTTEGDDYAEGTKYYNYRNGKWYTYQSGQFIPVNPS